LRLTAGVGPPFFPSFLPSSFLFLRFPRDFFPSFFLFTVSRVLLRSCRTISSGFHPCAEDQSRSSALSPCSVSVQRTRIFLRLVFTGLLSLFARACCSPSGFSLSLIAAGQFRPFLCPPYGVDIGPGLRTCPPALPPVPIQEIFPVA